MVQGAAKLTQAEATLRFRDVAAKDIEHCLAWPAKAQRPRHPAGNTWDNNYRGQAVRVYLPPIPPDTALWSGCDSPVVWVITEEWLAAHGIQKPADMKIAVCWHMVEAD